MLTGKKRALFALLLALTMVFSVAFGTVSALATTKYDYTINVEYWLGSTKISGPTQKTGTVNAYSNVTVNGVLPSGYGWAAGEDGDRRIQITSDNFMTTVKFQVKVIGHIDLQGTTAGGKTITGATIAFTNGLGNVPLSMNGGTIPGYWGIMGSAYIKTMFSAGQTRAILTFNNDPTVREVWTVTAWNGASCPAEYNGEGIDIALHSKEKTFVDVKVNRYYEDPTNLGSYSAPTVDTTTFANQQVTSPATTLNLATGTGFHGTSYALDNQTAGYTYYAAGSTASGTVTASGLTLNLYYKLTRLDYSVTVQYVYNGTPAYSSNGATRSGQLIAGQTVPVTVTPNTSEFNSTLYRLKSSNPVSVTRNMTSIHLTDSVVFELEKNPYNYTVNVEYRLGSITGTKIADGTPVTGNTTEDPYSVSVTPNYTNSLYRLVSSTPKSVNVTRANPTGTVIFVLEVIPYNYSVDVEYRLGSTTGTLIATGTPVTGSTTSDPYSVSVTPNYTNSVYRLLSSAAQSVNVTRANPTGKVIFVLEVIPYNYTVDVEYRLGSTTGTLITTGTPVTGSTTSDPYSVSVTPNYTNSVYRLVNSTPQSVNVTRTNPTGTVVFVLEVIPYNYTVNVEYRAGTVLIATGTPVTGSTTEDPHSVSVTPSYSSSIYSLVSTAPQSTNVTRANPTGTVVFHLLTIPYIYTVNVEYRYNGDLIATGTPVTGSTFHDPYSVSVTPSYSSSVYSLVSSASKSASVTRANPTNTVVFELEVIPYNYTVDVEYRLGSTTGTLITTGTSVTGSTTEDPHSVSVTPNYTNSVYRLVSSTPKSVNVTRVNATGTVIFVLEVIPYNYTVDVEYRLGSTTGTLIATGTQVTGSTIEDPHSVSVTPNYSSTDYSLVSSADKSVDVTRANPTGTVIFVLAYNQYSYTVNVEYHFGGNKIADGTPVTGSASSDPHSVPVTPSFTDSVYRLVSSASKNGSVTRANPTDTVIFELELIPSMNYTISVVYMFGSTQIGTTSTYDSGSILETGSKDVIVNGTIPAGYKWAASEDGTENVTINANNLTPTVTFQLDQLWTNGYTVTVQYFSTVGGLQVGSDILYANGPFTENDPSFDVNVNSADHMPGGYALAAGESAIKTVTIDEGDALHHTVTFNVTPVADEYSYIINVEYRYDGTLVRTGNTLTAIVGGLNPLDVSVAPEAAIIPAPYYLLGTDPKVVTVSPSNNVQTVVFELNSDEVPLADPGDVIEEDDVPLAEPTTGMSSNMPLIVTCIGFAIAAVGLCTLNFFKQKKSAK